MFFNYFFLPSSNSSLIWFQIKPLKESLMPSLRFLERFKDTFLSTQLRTNCPTHSSTACQAKGLIYFLLSTIIRQSKWFSFGIFPEYSSPFSHFPSYLSQLSYSFFLPRCSRNYRDYYKIHGLHKSFLNSVLVTYHLKNGLSA